MRTYGLRFDVAADAGDMDNGERGIVSHPERAAEFRENVAAATEIAERAGCGRLNAPYGWVGPEYRPSDPADSSTSFGWL